MTYLLFADILYLKKERRAHSLNRNFYADYIGLDEKAALKTLVGKRDKVEFAQTVTRYDKKFKVGRCRILTYSSVLLVIMLHL